MANNIPKPVESLRGVDLWRYPFKGAVPLQEGEFVVSASDLDENGEDIGGGIVANFNDLAAAESCYDLLMQSDPRHKPTLERMDWDTNTSELLRSGKGETIEVIRAKTQTAFAEGRVIRRRKK